MSGKPSVLSRKLVARLNSEHEMKLDPDKVFIDRAYPGHWQRSEGAVSFNLAQTNTFCRICSQWSVKELLKYKKWVLHKDIYDIEIIPDDSEEVSK